MCSIPDGGRSPVDKPLSCARTDTGLLLRIFPRGAKCQ